MNEAQILWSILGILTVLGTAWAGFARMTGRAEKREISGEIATRSADQFVTRDQCALSHTVFERRLVTVETDVRSLKETLTSQTKELTDAGERRAKEIYSRIERVTEGMNARLDGLSVRMEDTPKRTVELLAATGAINGRAHK